MGGGGGEREEASLCPWLWEATSSFGELFFTFKLGNFTNLKPLFPAKLTDFLVHVKVEKTVESSIEPKHYLNFDVIQCPIFISCPHKKHGEALGSLKKQKHRNHVTFALLIAYMAD